MADRRTAREQAYFLVFEKEFQPDMIPAELYAQEQSEQEWEYDPYTEKVFLSVCENKETIDGYIVKYAKKRTLSRISKAALAAMRQSIAELLFFAEEIPFRVSINEAVEILKKYDEPETVGFANGILNAVADELGLKDTGTEEAK